MWEKHADRHNIGFELVYVQIKGSATVAIFRNRTGQDFLGVSLCKNLQNFDWEYGILKSFENKKPLTEEEINYNLKQ